ncbi:hypothetical protein [Parabacteroides sp. FAFU027]|uniref:hypothetical protein n=1 Tax=Parabacteroides sp. FAFU027 TaxID=2922715 RepID=UPI001FAFB4B6|nr:hypothetical protein [Parabacteroides sp. FAFU027]
MVKKIFLLGGHDLEMAEIKHILDERKIKYFDAGLSWENAQLANYRDELEEYADDPMYVIYGVELREERPVMIPLNYYRVRHHNECINMPTSLEQVALLLDYPLTDRQKYIAANDRGYIPAMQAAGASPEEIAEIRRLDQMEQGITQIDIDMAEQAILEKVVDGGVTIVKSLTKRFTSICDRMFPYNRLIVYCEDELVYYGEEMMNVANNFTSQVMTGNAYYGGGKEGYFSIKLQSEKDRTAYLDEILNLVK